MAGTGLFFGDTLRPFLGEFEYVLTLSEDPPPTDEGLRHRHLLLPLRDDDIDPVSNQAIAWLEQHWHPRERLLVQSPNCVFAEFVVAAFFVHLGATPDEAILSLQQARPLALSQQLYQDRLRDREVRRV